MNKSICLLFVTALAANLPAETLKATATQDDSVAASPAKRRTPSKSGGLVEKPGSQKGRLLVLDAQGEIVGDKTRVAVERLASISLFKLQYEKVDAGAVAGGDWDAIRKGRSAEVAVFIVTDDKTPSLLLSPDEGWAVINAKRIDGDRPVRLGKQTIRAIALLGGSSSRFPIPLGGAYSVADLDKRPDMIPMDQVQQLAGYLNKRGMSMRRLVPYRVACRQGWAPAPTNDLQKAVWDEVYKLPTNPLPLTKPAK